MKIILIVVNFTILIKNKAFLKVLLVIIFKSFIYSILTLKLLYQIVFAKLKID